MDERPTYFAVIPANVRYDSELPPLAKLLFAEITALTNQKGYCWATNQYFAKLYGVSKRQIINLITALQDRGYIDREVIRENGEVKERRIVVKDISPPSEKNFTTPSEKNFTVNNTSINKEEPVSSDASHLPQQAETAAEYIFKHGVSSLMASGVQERNARSFLGRMRKAHGDEKVAGVLRGLERTMPSEPIPYIQKALGPEIGTNGLPVGYKTQRERLAEQGITWG